MHKRLFYYGDPQAMVYGWYPNAEAFRRTHSELKSAHVVRFNHEAIEPPYGYQKTGRGLANEPVERKKTMRDLVHALTP